MSEQKFDVTYTYSDNKQLIVLLQKCIYYFLEFKTNTWINETQIKYILEHATHLIDLLKELDE